MFNPVEESNFGPLAPFWFWNGDMEESRMLSQIRRMNDAGLRAFIICARQGLKIPYLSTAWFDRVRLAVAEAKRLGMEVWLYDEQPYPSLAGGGRVSLDHPEFEARQLESRRADLSPGERISWELGWGEVFSARAYPLGEADGRKVPLWDKAIDLAPEIGMLFDEEVFHETGLTPYNRKRFLACSPYLRLDWTAPVGNWRVFVFTQIPVRGHKYFDRFVDPLNPDAVRYFLKVTHDRYASELGQELGGTVKGIFTDEIHPIGYEGAGIPWSPCLIDLYADAFKRDLAEDIPALLDDGFPDAARIRYRFMKTVSDGFMTSYDAQVRDWCSAHGIRYIGEKPILRSEQLKYFHIPGIDGGHQKAGGVPAILPDRYRANPRILASAAHFYGKSRCLCESFHSIGWDLDIQDMKWTYDWLAMQGVNLFVNHAYYYTTANLTKHDAPPSEFVQMPWWRHQGALSRYVEDLVPETDIRRRRPRILLLDSITSSWTVSFADPSGRKRSLADFSRVQNILFANHFDFWIIDPRLLERAETRGPRLFIHGEGFEALVLPPMRNIEDGAFRVALDFARAGGLTLLCESAPDESIEGAIPADLAELANAARVIPDADQLPLVLESVGLRDFSVRDAASLAERTDVFASLYHHDDGPRCFVQNPFADEKDVEVIVFDGAPGSAGEKRESLRLGPFESRIARFDGRVVASPSPTIDLQLSSDIELRPLSANVLRLDEWELSVDAGATWALVRAVPLVDQLAAGGLPLPVRRQDGFGTPKTLLFSPVEAIYRCRFFSNISIPAELWIEPEGIGGRWRASLNGRPLDASRGARVDRGGVIVDAYRLGENLVVGENVLEFRVLADRSGDGIRTPMHIAGDFALQRSGGIWTIAGPCFASNPWNLAASGLPFYAGHIVCSGTFSIDAPADNGILLRIPRSDWRYATSLRVNGQKIGDRAWHPFVWEVPSSALRQGPNDYELELSTTRLGYFEGQYFDAANDRYLSLGD